MAGASTSPPACSWSAAWNGPTSWRPGPIHREALLTVLRDGPEVGVHTLLWCETLEQLEARLGEGASRHFGLRAATVLAQADSLALLDSAYGASLRPHHALLADEDRSRLVKFRPYLMPPAGWSLPA